MPLPVFTTKIKEYSIHLFPLVEELLLGSIRIFLFLNLKVKGEIETCNFGLCF